MKPIKSRNIETGEEVEFTPDAALRQRCLELSLQGSGYHYETTFLTADRMAEYIKGNLKQGPDLSIRMDQMDKLCSLVMSAMRGIARKPRRSKWWQRDDTYDLDGQAMNEAFEVLEKIKSILAK